LHLAARVQQARAAVDETTRERDRLQREHDDIAAERDDAPSVDPLRTAPRDGRRGAPLWQLVRFADGLTKEHAAALEGALHAAGLLTAWVHPDPDLTRAALEETDGDAYLLAEPNPHPGPTLADVLVPEEQEHVPTKTITALLRSVPHHTNTDAVTTGGIDTRARFGLGVLVGSHPKAAAEYIGATNRAQRRRERLATHKARLAELTTHLEELRTHLDRAHQQQKDHDRARADLPDPTPHLQEPRTHLARPHQQHKDHARARAALPDPPPIARAVRTVEHRATLVASARSTADRLRQALDTAVAEVDAARRKVRTVA